jgi:phage repressor protein C with HTH and peptisase S24 domain
LGDLAPGFGERVEKAAKELGSVEQAATSIGLGHNQLRRIIKEEAVPSFPAMRLLATKSGYRLDWLASNELPEKNDAQERSLAIPRQLMEERLVWIPELDARAAAGHSAMNDETEVKSAFPVPATMVQAMGVNADLLRLLEAKGDSMIPDINDGDRLIIYIGDEQLRDGKIYALNFGDDTLVKQLQLEPDGGLTLVSKNPSFPPRKIDKSDRSRLSIAGRVMGSIKRFV